MLMITLVLASFGVVMTEEESNPEAKFNFAHCLNDIIIKIGKTWMHMMVMLSTQFKKIPKYNFYFEILCHFGMFSISTFLSGYISIYGQLALIELSSMLFFSFLDVLRSCFSTAYYVQIVLMLFFYLVDILFFLNIIPHSFAAFGVFAGIHLIALAIAFRQTAHTAKTASSIRLVYQKVLNIGESQGKYCVVVQVSQPTKCIQILEFGQHGKHEIVNSIALPTDYAMLRAYHAHSKLILVQAKNMLYLYNLPDFKLLKLYDMGNNYVDTPESIRVRPAAARIYEEKSPCVAQERAVYEFSTPDNACKRKISEKRIENQLIDDVHLKTTSPNSETQLGVIHPTEPDSNNHKTDTGISPFALHMNVQSPPYQTEESPFQEKIEMVSPMLPDQIISPPSSRFQKKNSCYFMLNEAMNENAHIDSAERIFAGAAKLYITHDQHPLIAEVCTVGKDTQIRIINYLKNFEERKLIITMSIKRQEQLLQFVRIDDSDKIFFKSEVNSFCLIDINKNISEIVRQRADEQIQCSIINEREMILAEQNFLYIYDIPASLFVKKITSFHRNSHLLPILNAPGFYIVIPSPSHCMRISPMISQLINEQFAYYAQLINQNFHSLHIQNVIYDDLNQQLFIFTDKHIHVQKNVHLIKAVQPLVLDHVILEVSIYQQQCKDFF